MDYKKNHENFFQNMHGTTLSETFSLIYPTVFKLFISTVLTSIIFQKIPTSKFNNVIQFLLDFSLIIIPMIFSFTVLENYVIFCVIFLKFIATIVFYKFHSTSNKILISELIINETKRHFITNARATVTILSVIAILAVDFNIFPRRYAKTETYGYSLMDVGVGLFVFSNGIVAPEIKNKTESFGKSLTSTIPLWILGGARFLLTKETDYYVPVSEYGVHWNFFITLAVTKILSSAILTIIGINKSLFVSILCLIIHESLLQTGLSTWVLSNKPRDNFLEANREGIVASLGYVGLYFFSVYIGKIMSIYNKIINEDFDEKLCYKLMFLSAIFFSVTLIMETLCGVSRRLANAGYCIWIMFIGTFMCFLFLLTEQITKYLYHVNNIKSQIFVPLIFQAVNYNGLACFLLANILTGLINISIKTMAVGTVNSLMILILYMFVTCSIISILYIKKMKLKVW